MSSLVIPNNFVAATLIQSALVDANFTAVTTWANGNIDNTNIGAAGIFASQVIPTSAPQAAFGGTVQYSFPAAAGVAITGTLAVTGATTMSSLAAANTISGAVVVAGTIPGSILSGDLWANRSSSTGRLNLGNTTGTSYSYDGGITSAGNISILKNLASIATINGSTGVYTASDARLKDNIEPLPSGMLVIQALKPSTFTWKETGAPDVGFIAQEVQPLIPHAVITMEDETGKLGLAPIAIIPYLVRAVQELKAEFDAYVAAHP